MKKVLLFFVGLSLLGCSQALRVSDSDKFSHDIRSIMAVERSKSKVDDVESNIKKIVPAKPLTLKIRNISVEDFISLVFGDVLKYPYVLDRGIEQLQKKIDIEISNAGKSGALFPVVVSLLDSMGVDVQDVDGVILFTVKKSVLPGKDGGSQNNSKEKEKAPPADCVFIYKPIYSTAANLKLSVEKLLVNENSKVVVSEQNNRLIVRATEKEKRMIVKLLRVVDEKQKQVACDVTLAEITLTGDLSVGFQGFLKNMNLFELKFGANANNGYGITGSIFSGDVLSSIVQIGEKQGMIKIKANPYLLIADGSESSIEVGSEYPILKSEALAAVGTAGTIQTIEYRKTGVLISLKPVVAGDSVHLSASVELSEGQKNMMSTINSPSILNRKLKFNVVLLSEQALIVGGLVNETKTKDDYKIPLLGGVPYGLSSVASRTEIILIVKIKIIENEVFGDWFSDLSKKYEAQKIKNNI